MNPILPSAFTNCNYELSSLIVYSSSNITLQLSFTEIFQIGQILIVTFPQYWSTMPQGINTNILQG